MTRLGLSAVEKRITKLEQRTRMLDMPIVEIYSSSDWSADDQAAYHAATDRAERDAIIDKYVGVLSPHPDPLGVSAIVVILPTMPPVLEDDDDDDAPLGGHRRARTPEEQARIDRFYETGRYDDEPDEEPVEPAIVEDPFDRNPGGDPLEIIRVDEHGRRIARWEHQERRAKLEAQLRRLEAGKD